MESTFNQYDWPEWEHILSGGEVLKHRVNNAGRGRVAVVRIATEGGRSYIVKCWSRMALRALRAKVFRDSTGRNEYRASKRMATLSSHYPAVVSYNEVRESLLSYDEILVLEDLGNCEDSSRVLKRLLQSDLAAARELEEDIIQQTRFMLDSGMVDIDHRLNNFIVTADGFPVRIDFEHCKEYRYPYMHKESVGRMLGGIDWEPCVCFPAGHRPDRGFL